MWPRNRHADTRPSLSSPPLLRGKLLLGAGVKASDVEGYFLSFLDSAPSSPTVSPPTLFRAELHFVMEPLKGGVNMTEARKRMFEGLGGAVTGGSAALAIPWQPLGFQLLGTDVARKASEAEEDLEMVRGWWLDDTGHADAAVHQLLLEFRLRTEGAAFRSFEVAWGRGWKDELFKRLRDRLLLAERDLFVHRCAETGEPAAHLKMAWLEVWKWDALDQHPGRRKWFDLAAAERTDNGERS